MFEIGTADILEIPVTLEKFLNDEIPNFSNDCLASDFLKNGKNIRMLRLNMEDVRHIKYHCF